MAEDILLGYRGNQDQYKGLADKGVINTPENTDPDIKTKTKTKRNFRTGEVTEVTKYKNTRTGEKGGSSKTVGPLTKGNSISGNYSVTPSITYDYTPAKPSVTPTPPSSDQPSKNPGGNKPYVKPLKKPGYREAYEKTNKSEPFEVFKQKAIKWNKDNPPKQNKPSEVGPSIDRITPKPAMLVKPKLEATVKLDPSTSFDQSIKEDSWKKVKGKKKEKFKSSTLTQRQPKLPGLESTKSSVSCTKEGECGGGAGRMHSEGMFGTPTGKQKREIKSQMRKTNRASRKEFSSQMSEVRKKKRKETFREIGGMFKKNTAYKQRNKKGKDMRPLSVRLGFKS